LNSARLHELILFQVTFIQLFMSLKLHFSAAEMEENPKHKLYIVSLGNLMESSNLRGFICRTRYVWI